MVDFNRFLLVFSIDLRADNEEGKKAMQQSSAAGMEPGTLQFCDAAEPFVYQNSLFFGVFFTDWPQNWNHTIQMMFSLINHLQKHWDYSKASKKQQILWLAVLKMVPLSEHNATSVWR